VLQERPVEEVCERLGLTANSLYRIKYRMARKLETKMREPAVGEG